MTSRPLGLLSLSVWDTVWCCVSDVSAGCAGGCAWCTFAGNQHHIYRTFQAPEWLCVRKSGHFVLSSIQMEQCHDQVAFWFYYSSQRSCFCITHCVTHREMLMSQKHLNVTFFQDVIKTINHIKVHTLIHICSQHSVWRGIQIIYIVSWTYKWLDF